MRISDWSSDVCSSDLPAHVLDHYLMLQQALTHPLRIGVFLVDLVDGNDHGHARSLGMIDRLNRLRHQPVTGGHHQNDDIRHIGATRAHFGEGLVPRRIKEGEDVVVLRLRSEEHTSELQSLMRISYAVFCLKKKQQRTTYP